MSSILHGLQIRNSSSDTAKINFTACAEHYECLVPVYFQCTVMFGTHLNLVGTDERNRGRRMGPYTGGHHQGNYADAMAVDGDHMVGGAAT